MPGKREIDDADASVGDVLRAYDSGVRDRAMRALWEIAREVSERDASEVVTRAFWDGARALRRCESATPVRAWILGVRQRISRERRRATTRVDTSRSVEDYPANEARDSTTTHELLEALDRGAGQVTNVERDTLRSLLTGTSVREIAEAEGVSRSAVYMRLTRVANRLRSVSRGTHTPAWAARVLTSSYGELKPRERSTLTMRALGMTFAEIGNKINSSADATRSMLRRVHDRLGDRSG